MSSDEEYFPDADELSEEDVNGSFKVDILTDVIKNDGEEEIIDYIEEYEMVEELIEEIPEIQNTSQEPEAPEVKRNQNPNFSDEEQTALEYAVDELLSFSQTLSKEFDEKIPFSWESVTQKMKDAGYENRFVFPALPRKEAIPPDDRPIYQRLLLKMREEIERQNPKPKKINYKVEKMDDIIAEASDGEIVDQIEEEEFIEDMDEKIKCDLCHVSVKRKDMFDHQSVHRNDAPYKCNECGKTFRKKYPLKLHKRVHTNFKPYNCEICGMLFKAEGSYKRHVKRHLGGEAKRYQCEFCDTKWLSPYDLNAHRRTHTGEKPFLCHDCGASFAKISNLNAHQRRHLNIRNYKCDECDRTFIAASELTSHKVSHTGIKNFKCELCSRAFGTNEALSRHKARHPGLLNLVYCEHCNRRFRSEKGLQAHLNFGTCTEFKCPKCNLSFKSLNGLNAHHKKSKCMVDVNNDDIIEEEVDDQTQLLVVTDFMD